MIISDNQLNHSLALANFAVNAAIGTAGATVDRYSYYTLNQTLAGITLTIPTPTDTQAGHHITVSNKGSVPIIVQTTSIPVGRHVDFTYNGVVWTEVPAVAGSCLVATTRATLLALRTANGLSKDCDYVITDFVSGVFLAGTLVHLQATDVNDFGMGVQLNTLFDNSSWSAIYDIDANVLLEVRDNIGNVVKHATGVGVSSFDWGNPVITGCTVDNATWSQNIGNTNSFINVEVSKNSTLNTSTASGSAGWLNVLITNASTVNASSTSSMQNCRVANSSAVTLTTCPTQLLRCIVENTSVINCAGSTVATVADHILRNGSNLLLTNKTGTYTCTNILIENASVVNYTANTCPISGGMNTYTNGTSSNINSGPTSVQIDKSVFHASQINVGQGTYAVASCSVKASSISMSGAGGAALGLTLTRSQLDSATITLSGTGTATVTDSLIDRASTISSAATAGIFNITKSSISNGATVIIAPTASGTITVSNSNVYSRGTSSILIAAGAVSGTITVQNSSQLLDSSSVVKSNTGDLTVDGTIVSGTGVIDKTGTRTGIVSTSVVSEGSAVHFSGVGAGIIDTLSSSQVSTGSTINFTGSGAATTIDKSKLSEAGVITVTHTTGTIALTGVEVTTGSVVGIGGTNNVTITNTVFTTTSSFSRTGTASGTVNLTASAIRGASQISHTGARPFTMQRCLLDNQSVATFSATTAGVTDTITSSNIVAASSVTFGGNGITTANVVNNTTVTNGGNLQFSGNNAGTNVSSCTVGAGSLLSCTGNTVAILVNRCSLVGTSSLTFSNNATGTINVNNANVKSGSTVTFSSLSGAGAKNFNTFDISNVGIYTATGTAVGLDAMTIEQGAISHTGGTLTRFSKKFNSTLTTGSFNHTDCYHWSTTTQTLTASNTFQGRDRFNNTLV